MKNQVSWAEYIQISYSTANWVNEILCIPNPIPILRHSSASVYCTECKLKNKSKGGLDMRLLWCQSQSTIMHHDSMRVGLVYRQANYSWALIVGVWCSAVFTSLYFNEILLSYADFIDMRLYNPSMLKYTVSLHIPWPSLSQNLCTCTEQLWLGNMFW